MTYSVSNPVKRYVFNIYGATPYSWNSKLTKFNKWADCVGIPIPRRFVDWESDPDSSRALPKDTVYQLVRHGAGAGGFMSISIPGAVFSSLIFHLKNSPSDAEGFLYGSVRTHHVESITDSQSSGTREEKRLYVESFVCFSERFKFYDHYGRPHVERMNVLLREGVKRVVGWFSYRRNTSHRLSMREKVVHRRLTECFSDITSRDFLFGLVTEQVMDGSTALN